MSEPHVLLLGAPGAGKGTQSKRLADEFDIEHVTTGDALRSNKDMDISHMDTEYDTPRAYMEAGELVPDEVVNEIVKTALQEADGYVLDGYPRNLDQAEYLSEITDLDAVVFLDVSKSELVDRLTGRRRGRKGPGRDSGRNGFHAVPHRESTDEEGRGRSR